MIYEKDAEGKSERERERKIESSFKKMDNVHVKSES